MLFCFYFIIPKEKKSDFLGGILLFLQRKSRKESQQKKNHPFLFKKLKLSFLEIKAIILKKESYDFNIQSFIFEKEKSIARDSPAKQISSAIHTQHLPLIFSYNELVHNSHLPHTEKEYKDIAS